MMTQATVCCDPISWFQRARLISNPSAFVLGKPGLGKSTVVRRMALGLSAYGVHPLVLGDLKPDYVDAVQAIGGQVITLGRGRGYLNVLDPGQAVEAAGSSRTRPPRSRRPGPRRRPRPPAEHGRLADHDQPEQPAHRPGRDHPRPRPARPRRPVRRRPCAEGPPATSSLPHRRSCARSHWTAGTWPSTAGDTGRWKRRCSA